MNKTTRDLFAHPGMGVGVVALLVAFTTGCTPSEGAETEADDGEGASRQRVTNVEVISVSLTDFTDYIHLAGEVEAFRDVTVSADEEGRIERYAVEKGARVRRNQPIAYIDARVLSSRVEEARAAARLADEQFERQRRLWEEEQIGTEIRYLEAKYQAEIVHARLETLERRLARTVIRSPIDGVFESKVLEQGERAGTGDPVLRIVATDPLKITGGIPERFAPSIHPGDSARITFDVLPDWAVWGLIRFVGSTVNAESRTFPIEIHIRNPNGSIKPQMIANVQVVHEQLTHVVVVPQNLIIRDADGYHVFVVTEDDGRTLAERRSVTLGAAYGNDVVVEEGLVVGERLVTVGHQMVDDGGQVRIVSPVEAGTNAS